MITVEKYLGTLPNTVREVEDAYAADTVSLDGLSEMLAKRAKIMSLDGQAKNQAFRALSRRLSQFSDNEGSYWDLEELYTLGAADLPEKEPDNNPDETSLWYRCVNNARAVRERAVITEKLLLDGVIAQSLAHPQSPVEIFSIASGSARCIFNVILSAKERGIDVRARMLDINQAALKYSIKLAREMRLIDPEDSAEPIKIDNEDGSQIDYTDSGRKIEFMEGNVVNINGIIATRPVDVAEAVGINDYIPDALGIRRFLPKVHELLIPQGRLIISNIVANDEQAFLHEAVGWREMFYRDSEEFSNLLLHPRVGFRAENLTVHKNPNGIYRIIEARKES